MLQQKLTRAVTTLGLAMAVSPILVSAQSSTSRGLSIGLQALGTSISVDGGEENNGGGLGLRVGYGFNRRLTGFITLDGSTVDFPQTTTNTALTGRWTLANAELGARFHFANSLRRWVPYVDGAIGRRSLSIDDVRFNNASLGPLSYSGPSLTVGTGLSIFATRKWAFDTGLRWTGGKFTESDLGRSTLIDLDIEAASFRFAIGAVWWP